LTEKEKEDLVGDGRFKVFVRNPGHPIFKNICEPSYLGDFFMRMLIIDRYYPIERFYRGNKYAPGKDVEELLTLPNQDSLDPFKGPTQELLKQLPVEDAAYAKYASALEQHGRVVKDALNDSLYSLGLALESLLKDKGVANDPKKASMEEFWSQPDPNIKSLKGQVEALQQRVQYGDPLVIARRQGKGRVVAFLTSAGRAWNYWAGGSDVKFSYPVVLVDLQKYLGSAGEDLSRPVGSPLTLTVDAGGYEARMHASRALAREMKDGSGPNGDGSLRDNEDLPEQPGAVSQNQISFTYSDTRTPGIYFFDFFPRNDKGQAAAVEKKAYAFNVDTANESDLKRASWESLVHNPGSVPPGRGLVYLNSPASDFSILQEKQNDWSESPWLYLLILAVLVVEQLLAVHLSFHLKGDEAQGASAALRPRSAAA
jgi:hypothetical protein